jgi:hypothetical protein
MNSPRPERKRCPMCGRTMVLGTERLAPRPPSEGWLAAPIAFQYFACTNIACEHVERAA